jgi:predicted negative regulator of RcsB-dependent stress response
MANELIDEHEQGERVRQWLRDNASAIIGGVAVGLSLIFGWQWWERSQVERQITAATQYQALVDAVDAGDSAGVDALAERLGSDHGKTVYASLALMLKASQAVKDGKFDAAQASLEQALAATEDSALKDLIQIRLARIDLQLGRNEEGLSRLGAVKSTQYVAVVEELRGDLLLRLGRQDDARQAYADALAAMDAGAQLRFLVEMKLTDLGGSLDAES